MYRRNFFHAIATTAGGLVLPWEPRRVYSFGEDVGRVRRGAPIIDPDLFAPPQNIDLVHLDPHLELVWLQMRSTAS